MESLTTLVAESLARHGLQTAVDHRRLVWSPWLRCESGRSFVPVPGTPGIVALADEITTLAAGETPRRLLAVFHVGEAADLGADLARLFKPGHPLHARVASGRCFARFTQVSDPEERRTACAALRDWLTKSQELAQIFANPAA